MTSPITTASSLFDRKKDFLTFKQIAEQYPGCVTSGTLYCWVSTRRHGFHDIVTKVGSKSVVRRDRWEQFLESRTPCNSEQIAA